MENIEVRAEVKEMIEVLVKTGFYKPGELIEKLLKIRKFARQDDGYEALIAETVSTVKFEHHNLAAEIRDWISITNGNFSITELNTGLHLITKSERKNVLVILNRLKEQGIIEPMATGRGVYRKKDDSFRAMTVEEFENEDTEPVDLSFPLKLEKYARIFKTNVIVVAGEKDCGKTGFCLNFATMNLGKGLPIRYISSEFGAAELKDRLDSIEIPPTKWIKNVEFGQYQRNDMQDAIDPQAINIIDFLEVSEGKFFLIAEQIKNIYQRLRGGVALIALQKKRKEEYARGGELSAEKARLYITLKREVQERTHTYKNIATILHCKNRAIKEVNPNGLKCEYKLINGFYFKQASEWLPA